MQRLRRLTDSFRHGPGSPTPILVEISNDDDLYQSLIGFIVQDNGRGLHDLLVKTNTDVDFCFGRSQRSLLHVGSVECLHVLAKRGANLELRDRAQMTPVMLAARNNHRRFLRILVDEYHADLSVVDAENSNILHWLACNGRTELLRYAMTFRLPIDHQDRRGQTPLHVASQSGHHSAVMQLLEFGADVNKQDLLLRTPLFYACKYNQHACVQALLARGAQFLLDSQGRDPLDACLESGSSEAAALLVAHFPGTVLRLVQRCSRLILEQEKLESVLLHICQTDIKQGREILFALGDMTVIAGQQLLSLGSDFAETEQTFVRYIHAVGFIAAHLRAVPHAKPAYLQTVEAILAEISVQLAPLWTGLTEWLTLIAKEIVCALIIAVVWISLIQAHPVPNEAVLVSTINAAIADSRRWSFKSELSNPSASQAAALLNSFHDESISEIEIEFASPYVQSSAGAFDGAVLDINGLVNESSTDDDPDHLVLGSIPVRQVDRPRGGSSRPVDDQKSTHSRKPPRARDQPSIHSSARLSGDDISVPENASARDTTSHANVAAPAPPSSLIDQYIERLSAIVRGFFLCEQIWWNHTGTPPNFRIFVECHRDILRHLVERRPSIAFDHFHFLLNDTDMMKHFIDVIRAQPYENRKKWFYLHLRQGKPPPSDIVLDFQNSEAMTINRADLFESSCKLVSGATTETLKSTLNIQFLDEPAVGPGVKREWFSVLTKEILDPSYGLFHITDSSVYQPFSHSGINTDHLSFFHFVGSLIGLAIYHEQVLDVAFTQSLYKHILKRPVKPSDLESIDAQFAKSLLWIEAHDITQADLNLTFCCETNIFGKLEMIELLPNGSSIPVTEENKHYYIELVTEFKTTRIIRNQLYKFLEGFYRLIPFSLITIFNEKELELLISGLPTIDVEDWRANTCYTGFDANMPIVMWFWDIVRSYSQRERMLLLRFTTGSTRVSAGGFKQLACVSASMFATHCMQLGANGIQPFTIARNEGDDRRLPTASTCFNLLKLPEYTSAASLRRQLDTAIQSASEGFHYA